MTERNQKSKIKNKKLSNNLLILSFVGTLIGFTIYTFTQVDLNLTLSSNVIYQTIQQKLTYLGYFNRPFSTAIFLVLLILLFIYYVIFYYQARNKNISQKLFWSLALLSYTILLFSYPAFSHDIFNYLFDARIVTKYGLSPYYFKALDFPDDPWTRFMRWTHRYYPYGPAWLYLTLPFSYLGMEKFTVTLGLFKLMFLSISLGNIWLIGRLMTGIDEVKKTVAMIFFAFNPLVMIESIISPHNEVVMFFFTLLGLYFMLQNKKTIGILSILVATAIKFLPVIYLPLVFFSRSIFQHRRLYATLTFLTILALLPVIYLREAYSWYFIPVVGLAALSQIWWVMTLVIGISLGTLLRYAPFLYFGSYDPPVPQLKYWVLVIAVMISILVITIKAIRKKSMN